MPKIKARSAKQNQQLANARGNSPVIISQQNENQDLLDVLKGLEADLEDSKAECADLLEKLGTSREESAHLQAELRKSEEKSVCLTEELKDLKLAYKKTYELLRVERRAQQRWQAIKVVLEDEIKSLKSAEKQNTEIFKKVTSETWKYLDDLGKLRQDNSGLREKLSFTMQQFKQEMNSVQNKLNSTLQNLRVTKTCVIKLKKSCRRAAAQKERAVKKAQEDTLRKRSVHHLMHKGVYTEETRNLIRVLVKAGCSRDSVTHVISAVLKAAGVSVIGKISRRPVS